MAFDVEGAKQAGYSDAEIASHLAGTTNFDVEAATRKAWSYSDQEIIGQLAGAPAPAAQGEHGYAPAQPKPEPAAPSVIPWNPVGDELGNIYTPQTPPSLGDMRDAVPIPPKQAATPVDPSAPPGPMAAPVGGEFGDLSAQPWAQGEPVPEGKVAPAAKIANAAVEGWRATPSIMTPEGDDALNKLGPLFRQVINPGLKVLNVPIAAGNALMYGAAETANQITGDARAGRDVMAALNTLPFIQVGKLPGPRAPVPEPPSPRFVPERFAPDVSELDPRNAIKTLIEHDITENPPPAPDRGASNQSAHPLMEEFNREEPPSAATRQVGRQPPRTTRHSERRSRRVPRHYASRRTWSDTGGGGGLHVYRRGQQAAGATRTRRA